MPKIYLNIVGQGSEQIEKEVVDIFSNPQKLEEATRFKLKAVSLSIALREGNASEIFGYASIKPDDAVAGSLGWLLNGSSLTVSAGGVFIANVPKAVLDKFKGGGLQVEVEQFWILGESFPSGDGFKVLEASVKKPKIS